MSAPLGNQFWKVRSSHGRNPQFTTADELWQACCEYFQWVEDNPLYEDRIISFQGAATHVPTAKMRAMTIEGICIFLDIDKKTWRNWRESRQDLFPVVQRAEEVIRCQKFTGAAADLLNANIIARDLGLADKTEHTDKDGSELIPPADPKDIARAVAFILAKGAAQT